MRTLKTGNGNAARVAGLLPILAVLGIWQLFTTTVFPTQLVPPVTEIARSLWADLASGVLLWNLLATLTRLALGYTLAVIVGVAMGIAMGLSLYVEHLLDPIVQFLRPLPTVMIIPIAILFFGIGDLMKVVVIFYACVWPVLVNSMDGVKDVDRILVDTAKLFKVNGAQMLYKVFVPASSPFILSGMRISLAISMILAVTTEFIVGPNGIGYFIINALNTARTSDMYAGVFFTGIVAYLLNKLFVYVRSRVMRWHTNIET